MFICSHLFSQLESETQHKIINLNTHDELDFMTSICVLFMNFLIYINCNIGHFISLSKVLYFKMTQWFSQILTNSVVKSTPIIYHIEAKIINSANIKKTK